MQAHKHTNAHTHTDVCSAQSFTHKHALTYMHATHREKQREKPIFTLSTETTKPGGSLDRSDFDSPCGLDHRNEAKQNLCPLSDGSNHFGSLTFLDIQHKHGHTRTLWKHTQGATWTSTHTHKNKLHRAVKGQVRRDLQDYKHAEERGREEMGMDWRGGVMTWWVGKQRNEKGQVEDKKMVRRRKEMGRGEEVGSNEEDRVHPRGDSGHWAN